MSSFPKHFSLKSLSNNLYLRYVHEKSELNGFLHFSAQEVVSPYTKFEIEKSNIGNGYVHIKCCYNNKYWVLQSQDSHYVVAAANEKDEDQSKYSCTLFKPIYNYDKYDMFRFRHVYLNLYVYFQRFPESQHQDCLMVRIQSDAQTDFSTVINWDTMLVLPKHVAFKSIDNNKYLRPMDHNLRKTYHMAFKSPNRANPEVSHEVITIPDGHICIKNDAAGKFFTRDPKSFIMLDDNSSRAKDDPERLFWPIKLNRNVVALRYVGNNRICTTLTDIVNGYYESLTPYIRDIDDKSKFEIIDLVLSRYIRKVQFHLSDARRYNEKPLLVTSTIVENNDSQDKNFTIKLSYQDTTTSTWSVSVNPMFGVKMKIDTAVPKVFEGEIEFCSELSKDDYTWGETHEMKSLAEVVHEVTVPAGTKVKASVMATQVSIDIPFSYIQCDTLIDKKYNTQNYHDGLYNVVNCYNFYSIVEKV